MKSSKKKLQRNHCFPKRNESFARLFPKLSSLPNVTRYVGRFPINLNSIIRWEIIIRISNSDAKSNGSKSQNGAQDGGTPSSLRVWIAFELFFALSSLGGCLYRSCSLRISLWVSTRISLWMLQAALEIWIRDQTFWFRTSDQKFWWNSRVISFLRPINFKSAEKSDSFSERIFLGPQVSERLSDQAENRAAVAMT